MLAGQPVLERPPPAQARAFAAGKLSPPGRPFAEVPRALTARMTEARSAKVILVRAPAGFGKTTAMQQARSVLEAQGVATAWLTLDSADNDLPHFLAAFSAAIEQLGLEPRTATGELGLLDVLSRDGEAFVLFLDDFELIQAPSVLGFLREAIERMSRGAQIVFGSRSLPELGLGRLRARGQLVELDAEHLRFTPAEAAQFFRQCGIELQPDALEQVLEKTEGWVAALWLLSMALRRHGAHSDFVARFSGSDRAVADYLTEDVLAQQSPEVRDFLLRTSVLRHLSAPICQALAPYVDCERILRQLEASNIFLAPIASAPGVYRYHSLFAEFLRAQLARERPEDIARLHLAASGWYEAQRRPTPAIDHAIEGGDHPHALDLLERHAERLLEQGRMRLLDRWFGAVPREQLQRRPLLQVLAIWAECFTHGPWNAMERLRASGCLDSKDAGVLAYAHSLLPVVLGMMDRDEEAYPIGAARLAMLPSPKPFADTVLLNAMAYIVSVTRDRREAERLLDAARNSEGDSEFNRMYTESVKGLLDLREGLLRQATARFRIAVTASAHSASYTYTHGNAWAGVLYAGAVYEANDINAAQHLLHVYLPLAREVGLPDVVIGSHRMRARIAFDDGDVDEAFHLLTELEYLGHHRHLPRVVANAKLERSRLLIMQGNGPAAREELSRADDRTMWDLVRQQRRPAQEVEDFFVATLRVQLHFGETKPVLAEAERELARAVREARHYRAMKLRVLLALGLHKAGDPSRAGREMGLVLRQASREGFVRLIVDEGPALASVVRLGLADAQERADAEDPILVEYAHRLLSLFGSSVDESDSALTGVVQGTVEPLTRKEIRVLQLLAEGYSNKAMAEKLFVSDSTVRTHLRNINLKLKTNSRTQAVAAARKLRVIR
jgi:LuxR family maltose regulon positive regulatory protein